MEVSQLPPTKIAQSINEKSWSFAKETAMKMKGNMITAAASVLGAFALVFASNVDASPAKKKSTVKHATISQNVSYNFVCEGRVATIVSNALAGTKRDENAISFLISMDKSSGVATIMRPSGSRMIRTGRYAMFKNGSDIMINIDWTDSNNMAQILPLSFTTDGIFFGNSKSSQPSNVARDLSIIILGDSFASMLEYDIRHSVEGSCWQQ